MKGNPPPYTPEETKGLYPEVQGGPVPQQQYPDVYYPPQGPPAASAPPETESVTYYPTGPQQQQPQQLVINQPPVVVQTQQQRPSFVCHIILSCCVTWCCFCPCGFIAFVLAMVGYGKASTSPAFVVSARKYGTASFVFSILGIFIPIVVAIVLTAYSEPVSPILKLHLQRVIGCYHRVDGHCYWHKKSLSESKCVFPDSNYSDGYCYHN